MIATKSSAGGNTYVGPSLGASLAALLKGLVGTSR
jgi:hypothetical protein